MEGEILRCEDFAPPAANTPKTARRPPPAARSPVTLASFFVERFEPEYVRLQKPATRVGYDTVFRNHLGPHLGGLPLAAIDEDRLSTFRAELRQRLEASTCNVVLAKLAKILRFAKRVRLIAAVPEIEKCPLPRARPKAVLSEAQIGSLVAAAAEIDTTTEVLVLLALDAGLRCAEICALEWSDVDLDERSVTIQHNTYRGERQTPKGTIGKIALTSALRRALERHRRSEPLGPLVLYRRSHMTHGASAPMTPAAVRHRLAEVQVRAGIPESGPHLLRHTALTRLANLGASVYVVQAVARHSRLQTTQTYLHIQQIGLARDAAELLDRAAAQRGLPPSAPLAPAAEPPAQ